MRIAIFGGTFNPVHIGHIRGAISVYETFKLDKVIFLPTGIPPHKKDNVANAEYRYTMLKLAIEGLKFFEISRLEIDSNRVNYTIDTIGELKSQLKEDNLFFIVGTDAFYYLNLWKDYKRLVNEITFIVIRRPEYDTKIILSKYADLVDFEEIHESGEYPTQKKKIYIYTPPAFDVSSSMIRRKVRNGECIKYLVPEKVENFIKEKRLYQ